MHKVVEPEGVGQAVDGVEKAGDEDTLEDLVVREAGCSQRIDVFIGDLVRMLRQLHAEAEQRLVLRVDRQGVDVPGFGCCRRLLAASYRPQEK